MHRPSAHEHDVDNREDLPASFYEFHRHLPLAKAASQCMWKECGAEEDTGPTRAIAGNAQRGRAESPKKTEVRVQRGFESSFRSSKGAMPKR